jgi:hypothetical protein
MLVFEFDEEPVNKVLPKLNLKEIRILEIVVSYDGHVAVPNIRRRLVGFGIKQSQAGIHKTIHKLKRLDLVEIVASNPSVVVVDNIVGIKKLVNLCKLRYQLE